MNIFFTASLRGKERYIDEYKKIKKILNTKNKTISSHIFDYNLDQVHEWDPEYRFNFYKNLFDQIKLADLIVAEITTPSINVGYEVCIALELKKPAIILYTGQTEPELLHNIDSTLADNRLIIIQYGKKDLEIQLKKALIEIKHLITKRFTILLPPDIVNYLDKIAKERGIPRGMYIRQLIENDRDKIHI